MAEAPVLILRTTGIRSCLPCDEKRECFHCGVDLCLTPQRKVFLADGVRFSCVGCLGAIPKSTQILGPRLFSYDELSARSGVSLVDAPREEVPVVEAVKTERFNGASVEDVARMVATRRTCSVAGCELPHLVRGLCSTHRNRVESAVRRGLGAWDDKEFVARALSGELKAKGAIKETTKKEAAPVREKKPAAKPVVHRDVKPEKVLAPASADPELVALEALLAIAELEPEARRRVARVAFTHWGGA